MPEFSTKYFDRIRYEEQSVICFPSGLPGFDRERKFLLIEQPINKPLVFLQSLSRGEICFPTLPVLAIDPDFRLRVSPEDLRTLGLPENQKPRIGQDLVCLAIISLGENRPPTANLLSPVIINLKTNTAVQTIPLDSSYSHQHPLVAPSEALVCS
jgi:flagellar assembly factor FliW